MDNVKFQRHLEDIKRGDPGQAAKFERTIRALAADPKISKMPKEAQDAILDKISNRYKKEKAEVPVSLETDRRIREDQEDRGMLAEGLPATPPETGRFTGQLQESLRGFGQEQLTGAAGGMLVGGLGPGQVLEGIMNPANLMMGVGTAFTDATLAEMGFDMGSLGTIGDISLSAATAGLAMVNPALAVTARVMGKPVVELARDWTDTRTFEEDRDAIEDTYGKVRGMQLTRDYMDRLSFDIEDTYGDDVAAIRDVLDIKETELASEIERLEKGGNVSVDLIQQLRGDIEQLSGLRSLAEPEAVLEERRPEVALGRLEREAEREREIMEREQIREPGVPTIEPVKEKRRRGGWQSGGRGDRGDGGGWGTGGTGMGRAGDQESGGWGRGR